MDWNDNKPNESFAGVLDDFDICGGSFFCSDDECSFEDFDEDGYDDESYDAGLDIGALSGDGNGDGVLNVSDLVHFVNIILNGD